MDEDHSAFDTMMEIVHDVMILESDRGCVLVGAALIEWQMGELLRAVFLEKHPETTSEETKKIEKQIDMMLNPTSEKSILGAAAARGRMCRVLNLIPEDIHKLLKVFLVFRNEHFAHAHGLARLSNPPIKRALDDLVRLVPDAFHSMLEAHLNNERETFIRIVVVLYYFLDYRSQPSSS